MLTVTERIKTMTKKSGTYIETIGELPVVSLREFEGSPKSFTLEELDYEMDLHASDYETVSPSVIGPAVEGLFKMAMGQGAGVAFRASYFGAILLDNIGKLGEKHDEFIVGHYTSQVRDLMDQLGATLGKGKPYEAKHGIDLCTYDVVYRTGNPAYYRPYSRLTLETEENVYRMVDYAKEVFKELHEGDTIKEVAFDEESFGRYIAKGDGDFMTDQTLWDMKVWTKSFDKKVYIQLLCYYLLGMNGRTTRSHYENLEYIGVINPRLQESHRLRIADIPQADLDLVREKVIGMN